MFTHADSQMYFTNLALQIQHENINKNNIKIIYSATNISIVYNLFYFTV